MKRMVAFVIAFCLVLCNPIAMAELIWSCPKCATQNAENYCGNCGEKRPDWNCSGCGNVNVTNYCVFCGMPKLHSYGIYFMEEGNYDAAIDCFREAEYGDYQAHLVDAYYKKGNQYTIRQQWAQAIDNLEDSWTTYTQIQEHEVESVFDLPENLQTTLLTLAYCYLSSGDASYQADDWDAAVDSYLEGITIVDAFTSKALSSLPDVHSMFSGKGYNNWDGFFFLYGSQFESMGRYDYAVDCYERVSWGQSLTQAAKEKRFLQQKYAKQFNLETMYCLYSSEDYFIGECQMDQIHSGDYTEGQTLHPALRIINTDANQTAEIKLTAIFGGKTYRWGNGNVITIPPQEQWEPHLNSEALPEGSSYCEWYFDDVLVARIKYDVIEGESKFKSSVVNRLKVEMDLCLWNPTSRIVVEENVDHGVLSADNSNLTYAPRLKIFNDYRDDADVVVSVSLNGQNAVFWNDTIAKGNYKSYLYTTAESLEGQNTCVWYINGIEVLREEYTITSLPEGTAEPTAAPTNTPAPE